MGSGLEHLLAEGVISEVLARLQSGKEAEVYVVRFGGRVVAAKVYKDRATRSFKNNADYKEGRAVRNTRSQRAMASGSRFGKAAAEDAWKSAEADALYKLHAAEVRVPAPVLFIDGILLMELVLDEHGNAARRLIDTSLTLEQANRAYHDMLSQLVRMLSCDLIHGDLSPYNVLWGAAGPTVIDFPQIVSASHNSSSERFFRRDAENILGHLARIDRSLQARYGDIAEIWRAYLRRELTPEFVPTGKAQRELRGPPRHQGNAHPPQKHVQNQPPHARRPARGPEVIVLARHSSGSGGSGGSSPYAPGRASPPYAPAAHPPRGPGSAAPRAPGAQGATAVPRDNADRPPHRRRRRRR